MRLCRFDENRLGYLIGDVVYDVSAALDSIAPVRWPLPPGDLLIINLPQVRDRIEALLGNARKIPLASVALLNVVANPGKIMAAPANYRLHVEIDARDPGVDHGVHYAQLAAMSAPTEELGLFLKAGSSVVGPSQGVEIAFPDRRTDYEVELAVVIGSGGKNIARHNALEHVAGYMIGLDMSVRGKEDRSFRKSADSYTVLGPWLVTTDEIENPSSLDLKLSVNGKLRQSSNTANLTVGIERMIELASCMYTLYPGDILLTGTPEGVGQVFDGDILTATCQGIGEMSVTVREAPR